MNLLIADEDSITPSNEYPANIKPSEFEVGCDGDWRYLLPPEPDENFVEYTIR